MTSVRKAAQEFRRLMMVMSVFSLATNLLMLTVPLYMLQIYDRVLPARSNETLIYISLFAALALLTLGLLEVVRAIAASKAAARFDVTLSDLAVRSIIRVGAATGGNTQPFNDVNLLRGLLSSKVAFVLLDLPFTTIFIAILYLIHPNLFWITLGGAVILVILAVANQMATRNANQDNSMLSAASNQQVDHLARNADSLIAMGMVDNAVNYWGNFHAGSLKSSDRAASINAWFAGISRTLRIGLQILILGYGAKLVLDGQMTAGMIFASSIIAGRALQPIDQTIGSWRQLTAGWQAWLRVRGFLEQTAAQTERTELPVPIGKLEVNNVHVPNPAGPTSPPILQNVAFQLEPGESVAIIGPSGSGKTTLARIIVGALKAKIGHVRIDGHDIWNWDRDILGKHIGYLAQDVELLPGTVAQNISRFAVSEDDDAVIRAAQLAHVEPLIQNLPNGFDTKVGPGGLQLSGGEKQRIAMARAFYGKPKLLVLDEPNSSLDDAGNTALLEALADAKTNNITVVMITQRISALDHVDKILIMDSGQVREFGSRQEVIARIRNSNVANRQKSDGTVVSASFAPGVKANLR